MADKVDERGIGTGFFLTAFFPEEWESREFERSTFYGPQEPEVTWGSKAYLEMPEKGVEKKPFSQLVETKDEATVELLRANKGRAMTVRCQAKVLTAKGSGKPFIVWQVMAVQ